MPGQILYRTAVLAATEGRTIHGIAVPYGQVAEITEWDPSANKQVSYSEKFVEGAFARSISERGHKVQLMIQHDQRSLPVGRATDLREEPDGLHAAFEVAKTSAGDDLLELVRTEIVDSFSIGFIPLRERWEGNLRVHLEAGLREVSAVTTPAYKGAKIAGVRFVEDISAPKKPDLVISRALAERRLRLLELERR